MGMIYHVGGCDASFLLQLCGPLWRYYPADCAASTTTTKTRTTTTTVASRTLPCGPGVPSAAGSPAAGFPDAARDRACRTTSDMADREIAVVVAHQLMATKTRRTLRPQSVHCRVRVTA